ncbi:hypothetical protein HFN_1602 [Helicobacter fennelliae MRY12-0050]|uniref:Uncharacterized protein n=1 Tax=Helicobacter fennelliae MRY12-0050 TaxID=1325130 RepID=T1DVQ2_9HELI|nr:hypothetical protein HFN_0059 [Helicobacter fennelliae MRY12-0050]GAD20224.1 hypothetical protein HFN_1602 [Helicobacter fennelliae MRY12-0050]
MTTKIRFYANTKKCEENLESKIDSSLDYGFFSRALRTL